MRLDKRTRIDAMFSGTTTVLLLFDQNMIVSANAGDSRAILISRQEEERPVNNTINKENSPRQTRINLQSTNHLRPKQASPCHYYTQLSRDHKPELADEAQRIMK